MPLCGSASTGCLRGRGSDVDSVSFSEPTERAAGRAGTIGDLAAAVGVNPKTIRYYEEIGLLPEPARSSSGYRSYEERDVERLVFVRTAQRLSLSLAEIAEILAFRDRGERPCGYVMGVLDRQVAELDRRIAELNALRSDLVTLKARADELSETVGSYCTVIEHAAVMTPPGQGARTRPMPIAAPATASARRRGTKPGRTS